MSRQGQVKVYRPPDAELEVQLKPLQSRFGLGLFFGLFTGFFGAVLFGILNVLIYLILYFSPGMDIEVVVRQWEQAVFNLTQPFGMVSGVSLVFLDFLSGFLCGRIAGRFALTAGLLLVLIGVVVNLTTKFEPYSPAQGMLVLVVSSIALLIGAWWGRRSFFALVEKQS